MPRVAYMTPWYFSEESIIGGGERFPSNVAKGVAMTGEYEVEIVSYGNFPEQIVRPLADGVTLRVLPNAQRRPGAESISWDVIGVARDVDLVHVHQIFTRPGEVAVLAAKLLGKPVCATDHGGASSWLGRSLGMLELVDAMVPYSEFGASIVDTPGRVDVVLGGVDDHYFTPPEVPVRRDRVLFVGRLLPHKGIDRLLAALPADVPLTICGRHHRDDYSRLLRSMAKGKQVEFVTAADDAEMRELYRRAICVVLPSVYVDCYGGISAWPELMGLSLLEGMACGAPAICSRVGAMPEFVRDGETGFVFDEIDELRAAIRRLADDPELVRTLGAQGLESVNARFGLEPVGARFRAIYDELLGVGVR